MFDFRFFYSNDFSYAVYGVTKIVLETPDGPEEIFGDDILSINIPLTTMYLHNAQGNHTISANNLAAVEVTKHEP